MGHLITSLQKNKTIIQDGFNRTDSAVTMGNANTGQAWSPLLGTWGISGNQAYCINTTGTNITVVDDAKTANGIFSLTLKFSVSEGIVFRLSDSSNYLALRISTNDLSLIKTVANVTTAIGSYIMTTVVGTVYSIKVVCNGSRIQCYLDGVLRLTVIDSFNSTATKCGLRTNPSTAGRFDEFLVENI